MRQRNSLAELFDTLMSDSFSCYGTTDGSAYRSRPALNIIEAEDQFKVQYATPGMTREEVEVKLDEEQRLQISVGIKKEEADSEENPETETAIAEHSAQTQKLRYLRHEFGSIRFTQKFNLPEDIDLEGITASMENGLLEVRIPKKSEEEKAKLQRTIAIS